MTFETFVKIVLAINVLMICCAPIWGRRYKRLKRDLDVIDNNLFDAEQDARYWEAEYHKLHARYAHGQVCIGKLVRENKALKSQAPKRRGRAPKKDASTDE